MARQHGIGLIELMVSLFLSCFLMTAIMQHYLSCKEQYIYAEQMLEQGFELQLVSELIRDSVRRAGFSPCIGVNYLESIDRRDERQGLFAIKIIEGKRPVLSMARMSEDFSTILKIISPTQLLVDDYSTFEPARAVLIADCFHAEVQIISGVKPTQEGLIITLKKPLAFDYIAPVYLGEWWEEKFFIQTNNKGNAALFYQNNHAEELSAIINQLSAQLVYLNEHSLLVQVTLGLIKGNPVLLETKVRAS